MIHIFFLSQSSPILELFPIDKITLKSYICTVVTIMAKQCWSQTVLESGSWGHSVLQTPALVSTKLGAFCSKKYTYLYFLMITWLYQAKKVISSMCKMCRFTSSCARARSHLTLCFPLIQSAHIIPTLDTTTKLLY